MTASASETVPAVDDFAAQWQAWHRGQEARLADRHGFLAITSTNWPRHPDNQLRTAFRGTPTYPPDPRWAVTGRYVPFAEPRPTAVGSVVDGLEHVYDAPGQVEFTLSGCELSLTAFPGHQPGSLFILFADATSGVTTYAANRSLQLAPPAADGTVVLDFNRAANLPCAYTDLATCPLPPAGNRLPIAVEAGEKIPYERG
jgi:uncharacterized protein (DUF1684 family)